MPLPTIEERITPILDLIQISAEAQALMNQAQIEIDLNDFKIWYFKRYVTIGSGYLVEYIAYKNREAEEQLAQDAMQIETESQQNQ